MKSMSSGKRLLRGYLLLYIELVSLGTINAILVEPMDVYSWALQKRCVKIMLVHYVKWMFM